MPVLLGLFDAQNSSVQHYFVLPQLRIEKCMYNFRLDDQFFLGARELKSLNEFYDGVWSVNKLH